MKATYILCALAAAAALAASCTGKNETEAQAILDAAQERFNSGDYEKSLSLIDSLRSSHPEAIEQRKAALTLYQKASERIAQRDIEESDKLLQEVEARISSIQGKVENDKRNGNATAGELQELTRLRIKRDSLKARFDTQCAVVRVIREKQKR